MSPSTYGQGEWNSSAKFSTVTEIGSCLSQLIPVRVRSLRHSTFCGEGRGAVTRKRVQTQAFSHAKDRGLPVVACLVEGQGSSK